MTKGTFWMMLTIVWLPWLGWLGFGLWLGGWSISAKHDQLDQLSRAIHRGVVDVKPYIEAGLESDSKDRLDIAVDRLAINPSAASDAAFGGVMVHALFGVTCTVILTRWRSSAQKRASGP